MSRCAGQPESGWPCAPQIRAAAVSPDPSEPAEQRHVRISRQGGSELVDGQLRRRRERNDGESHLAEGRKPLWPRIDGRERQPQDRAHGCAHRLPIERISARRIEKDAVCAERRRASENAADVVWVPDRFEKDETSRARKRRKRQRAARTVNEGEAASVKLEPGDAVDNRWVRDEHQPARIETRLDRAECPLGEQHRIDRKPAVLDQPLEHESSLGDEQALRLEPRRVTNVAIGLEARVVDSGDVGDQSSLRCTDRRLRWLSITCWPSRLLRNTLDSPLSTGWGTKRMTSKASCARYCASRRSGSSS